MIPSGVRREFFTYPLLALKKLESRGVRAWPALMEDFFSEAEVDKLKKTLQDNEIQAELELECLEPYPFVLENIRKRGLSIKR